MTALRAAASTSRNSASSAYRLSRRLVTTSTSTTDHQHHRHVLLQIGRALGHERPAVARPVLVGRADDLHGGDQHARQLVVVHAHFAHAEAEDIHRGHDRRRGRNPCARGGNGVFGVWFRGILLKPRHVGRDGRSQADMRLGDETERQRLAVEPTGDKGRPRAVNTLPMALFPPRRVKMIQRVTRPPPGRFLRLRPTPPQLSRAADPSQDQERKSEAGIPHTGTLQSEIF